MIEILSNLLGETVEVRSDDYVIARGAVRGIYPMDRGGAAIVVENTYDSSPIGLLRGYDMFCNSIRVVRQCGSCGVWSHPSELARPTPDPDFYEHAACRRARMAGNTP